ncbi:acyl-CoA-binding domain-containing protein 6 [Lingula anatina]|uniref:Acyl-CoA-binding domain-containing protein 6 n=1 Tax=Lingula anatina TaxID=7574 RepID=A0A1S3HD13_LINAN|nr:acyl-CoA-binding domain-containing protein 6 [Lingula anatina]|eukprot:XP_013383937.1 acyl-CoA-binding domain-containing protein 6 [Lingula anatina]
MPFASESTAKMSEVDLFQAAKKGNVQKLTNLLRDGTFDVNTTGENPQDAPGRTPLHWAAERGATQCVKLLLKHGADPNILSKMAGFLRKLFNLQRASRLTPLHLAAEQGATQCVQLLLQHGANPNIQDKSKVPHSVSSFSSSTGRILIYRVNG